METHRTPNGDPRRPGGTQRRRSDADDDRRLSRERESMRRETSTGLGWLWVLPLAALAGLGWYLLRGTPTERTDITASRETVQQPAGTSTPAATAWTDVQKQAAPVFAALTTAFQGIHDQASATTALPRIQAGARDMEKVAVQSVQLPADARKSLANATHDEVGKLNTLIDNASNLPGVGPILQPAVASLRGRMDAIAMVPGKPLFYAAAPSADWVPLSSVFNREVIDQAGHNVGTATGFYLGSDGRIVASVLSVDRQLGIGDKQVAMPFAIGQLQRKGDNWKLVVDTSKEELQKAKGFER